MTDQHSDGSLKKWYRIINTKFFKNELPDDVIVRWARGGEESDVASCSPIDNPDKKNKYLILLNRAKNPTTSIKLSSLAHEMVHVATKNRDAHGEAFDEWHKKLTERGLFRRGALLSNTTLF